MSNNNAPFGAPNTLTLERLREIADEGNLDASLMLIAVEGEMERRAEDED